MLSVQAVEALFTEAARDGVVSCEYGCTEYTQACTDCIDTFEQAYDLFSE